MRQWIEGENNVEYSRYDFDFRTECQEYVGKPAEIKIERRETAFHLNNQAKIIFMIPQTTAI